MLVLSRNCGFLGKFVFILFTFWTFISNISQVPTQHDMQNEALFNIILLGLVPPWGIFFLLLCTVFGNGILRIIYVKRPVATLHRCELAL
jgi:hypothetical protein